MKRILVFDCEATTYEKGNPFSESNRLMCVGTFSNGKYEYHDIEYSGLPYNKSLERLAQLFKEAQLIIGFNIKYDLHWIRRYIPDVVFPPVFDCQLAEFLISNQHYVYPSLEVCSDTYDLPLKLTLIEDEYWNKGIDTPDVPLEILKDRVLRDCEITWELYNKQLPQLTAQGKDPLFKLQCDDLLCLADMEFNGMLFDEQEAARLGAEAQNEIQAIHLKLAEQINLPDINWNSGDHLSAILYGGYINYPSTEIVTKILKSGKISSKERKCWARHKLPQLVAPLKGSESKPTDQMSDHDIEMVNARRQAERKPYINRVYYTNENIFRSLPATGKAKKIITFNLRLSELEKLCSTYYLGIPKLIDKLKWKRGSIHGQFNQCVARTGRLSSSKPNLQNFAGVIKPLFKSRYAN